MFTFLYSKTQNSSWHGEEDSKFIFTIQEKIKKYRNLIKMLCKSNTVYICKLKIYDANGVNLQDIILELLNSHLFLGTMYIWIVIIKVTDWLSTKTAVCGMRTRLVNMMWRGQKNKCSRNFQLRKLRLHQQ